MIIDFHTHVFPEPVAAYAIPNLERKASITAAGDGTVGGLLRSMDESGIDRAVLCPVATKPDQVESINHWIRKFDTDRLIPFGALFPGMETVADHVAELADHGIRGVKLHADYQRFFVDDEAAFPMYEACREKGLIVLFHAGVDIGMPEPYHATPERLARVLDAFPGLTVVAAHLGGYQMWDGVREHLVGRDLFFDLAYFSASYQEDVFLPIMREHGMDRILFATDFPWLSQVQAMEEFARWPLTVEERRLVQSENAMRLLELDG